MKPRYNWNAARAAYLNAEGSLRELSQRFHIPRRSLERRAAREGWRHHANQIGGSGAAVAANVAAHRGHEIAERLSLPERSAKLREGIAKELERDLNVVSRHEPEKLEDAALRQTILKDMTGNAKVVHGWSDTTTPSSIRIGVLNQLHVSPAVPEEKHALSPPR
jgi:hypothetical protein